MKHRATVFLATFLLSAALMPDLSAQQVGKAGPYAMNEFSTNYSYLANGTLEGGGKIGSVAISQYGFEATAGLPAPVELRLTAGLVWERDDLQRSGEVPLPKRLEVFGLNVWLFKDLNKEFGPGWNIALIVRPEFLSDSSSFSGKSFNGSTFLSVGRTISPNLSWNLGFGGFLRSSHSVVPVVGLRWNFAPDWNLSIGVPQSAISYKISQSLLWRVGVRVEDATYSVKTVTAPGLENTYLEFREFRLGTGVDYSFTKNLSLSIDGGATFGRLFDYYQRNYHVEAKSAGFISITAHLPY